MPRLSKAERQSLAKEQWEQEKRKEWAELRVHYPRRLLNLVFEYSNRPELVVRKDAEHNSFVFSRPREMSDKWLPFEMQEEYNPDLCWVLAEVEHELSYLVEAEAEAQRVYGLRQRALSKLSAEERQALNL